MYPCSGSVFNVPSWVEYLGLMLEQGTDANHISGWDDAMNAAISAGATHLLGYGYSFKESGKDTYCVSSFNEPDNSGQAAMTPQQAADAWKQHIQPYAGRVKLVSPAITNGAPPSMGTGWMDQFIAACTGCTIDAIAVHIYDRQVSSNAAYIVRSLTIIQCNQHPVLPVVSSPGGGLGYG
jgi:hypothetical protein